MNKPFTSPTTPGLSVSFADYVVELVCLNMEKNLPQRFWRDNKYWGKKYGRERMGFSKFAKLYDNLDDPTMQRAIINAVKILGNKSLLVEKTLQALDRIARKQYDKLIAEKTSLAMCCTETKCDTDYMQANIAITNIDTNHRSRLNRILEIEQSGQKENRPDNQQDI
jgi:hypothetical protein